MNFQPVIGIEIHVELKTKSKMFSRAPVGFGSLPNTMTVPYDFGFPGVLPVLNKKAVEYGVMIAEALNMKIDRTLYFDRKNYFYSDLPKGYQITQQDHPIGSEGWLEIATSTGLKRIGIERAHLEEDTAKQIHLGDCTLVDYNRAGTPLVEIVSKPDIRTGEEAARYVEAIREIVTYLEVSEGRMEEGNLRCDINASLMPYGSSVYGTKVEIKNLNSIGNVKAALDYEIERQAEILLSGETVKQETRRYDEGKKCTVLMRVKTNAVDYKYFREPNILPIDLEESFIAETIKAMKKLPSAYREELSLLGLSSYEIEELLRNKHYVAYFEEVIKAGVKSVKTAWNYLMVDILGHLNAQELKFSALKILPCDLAELSDLVFDGKINSKQGKAVLEEMLQSARHPQEIIAEKGLAQVSDQGEIQKLVEEVLASNAQSISDFMAGKDRALGYIVGQVMKASRGRANPSLAKELVLKALEKKN